MPTRSNKGATSPAAQTTGKKVKKGDHPAPMAGTDPPIIVDGGGSVTIYSQYPFDLSIKPGDKYPYVLYSRDATVGKMKMKGKGGDKDDESDKGTFKIELYS